MVKKIPTSDKEIEQVLRKLLRENGLGKLDFIKSHVLIMQTLIQFFIHESLVCADFEDFLKMQPLYIQERFEQCYHFGKAFEIEVEELSESIRKKDVLYF